MKKVISVLVCLAMAATCVLAFAGCSNNSEDLTYDIVMITDGGTVNDGAYNESAWNGVTSYAEQVNADAAEGEEKPAEEKTEE